MVLALADNFGAERSDGALAEELVVVFFNIDFFLYSLNSLDSDVASTFETISDLKGVNTLVKELLSLVKESTGKNDDTSSTVTDFVVLRLGELDEEAGSLVLHLHLLHNSGTVVSDNHITIRAVIDSINLF